MVSRTAKRPQSNLQCDPTTDCSVLPNDFLVIPPAGTSLPDDAVLSRVDRLSQIQLIEIHQSVLDMT